MKINAQFIIYPIVVAIVSGILSAIPTVILGTPLILIFASVGTGGAVGSYIASVGLLLVAGFLLWTAGYIIIKVVSFFDADKKIA